MLKCLFCLISSLRSTFICKQSKSFQLYNVKWTVSRVSVFFHQTIPLRALIHGLKPFYIWLRFRRENRDNRLQSSDPAVSMRIENFCHKISAVSMRPRDRFPRSHCDRGNFMTKIFNFYLRIFGCSLPEPHNFSCWIPRYQWDRGNFMRPQESLHKRILVIIPFKGKPS
jgi:hypothetical protein